MFVGQSQHTLDDKGRINLPARFRDVLSRQYDERLVVTLSARGIDRIDRCLHVFPRVEFEGILERLRAAPASDPAVMLYKRKVVSNAEECQLDKQGRILVPALLREKVGVAKDAMLVGDNNLIEMWSVDEWKKAQDVDDMLLQHRDRLAQYGL